MWIPPESSAKSPDPSSGPKPEMRVLLVEDNYLVAMDMRRKLEAIGCSVVGPVPSLIESLAAVSNEDIAGAILDINIIGGTSAPVAHELIRLNTPFFFVTGYGSPTGLPDDLKGHTRLQKPVEKHALEAAVQREFLGPTP